MSRPHGRRPRLSPAMLLIAPLIFVAAGFGAAAWLGQSAAPPGTAGSSVTSAPSLAVTPSASATPGAIATPTTASIPTADSAFPLPDRTLTPGDILTTDAVTVCQPGYASSVRAVSVAEKREVDDRYGWHYVAGAQEYDHLIPLELGGSDAITNLWPEPIVSAHIKDTLENRLHALVCAGSLPLVAAQQCIAVNWVDCARRYSY